MSEVIPGVGIILDTKPDIKYFSLLSLIGRCEIEVETGLKWRQSNVQIAKRVWGTKSRTVKGTLQELYAIKQGILEARAQAAGWCGNYDIHSAHDGCPGVIG